MTFKTFNFKPFIYDALEELHFTEPSPIQEAVIPIIQAEKSLVAQSQTGTGKSHAFLLPLMNQVEAKPETQIVITAPSRELGEQLYQAAKQLSDHHPEEIMIERAFGGTDTMRQSERLEHQVPQIVVGTPGRLLDLIERQALSVHQVHSFVVDEADMTLDRGFLQDVDQIAGRMPNDLNMYVFSATIPTKLRPFLRKYMQSPEWIQLQSEHLISETIDNYLLPVRGRDAKELLYEGLTIGQPYLALIFANTIETVKELYQFLKAKGLSVGMIHGDLDSRERRRMMKQIQNLEYQYVVATDLAARGIDIEGVSHVFNYEVPGELEFFIHRVGRTGRQGLPGLAVTLYEPDDQKDIEWLEDKGIRFEFKDIQDSEWIDAKDHSQRRNRKKQEETDHTVKGMVERNKRQKVKPGYKRKLKRNIKQHKKNQRLQDQRQKRKRQRQYNKEKNHVDY